MDGKSRTILGVLIVLCTIRCIGAAIDDSCFDDPTFCDDITNGECSSSFICACKFGYTNDGSGSACSPKTIGDPCTSKPECLTTLDNTICDGTPKTCQCADGYMQTGAICDIIQCPALVAPADGAVDTTGGFDVDAVALFSCNTGYTDGGTASITCQDDGAWTVSSFTCTIKDCGSLTQPDDGTAVLDGSTSTYLSTATFACNTGFSPDATLASTCQDNGNWDVTTHTCTIKNCGGLASPPNGGVDTTGGTTYDSTAFFSCDPGYLPVDPVGSVCLDNAIWTVTLHNCVARDCGDPAPTFGSVSESVFTYPNTVTVSCDPGYDRSGSESIECTASGAWSENPTCAPKDCGDPTPLHGAASTTVFTFPNNVIISCESGYDLVGATATITCTSSGLWSLRPTCEPVDCGSPAPTNGYYTGLTTFLETASIVCNSGYIRSGSPTVTCQASGNWNSAPGCDPVNCGNPSPSHGTATGSFVFPTTASISCESGYNRNGLGSITCLDTGSWSSAPTCDPEDCEDPSPLHGMATGSFLYPTTASISCDNGYNRVGLGTISCLDTGSWSSAPTCDPVDCLDPPHVNGFFNAPLGTTFQQQATITCANGYDLSGVSVITCQAAGSWSGTYSCNPVACPSLTAPANGVVTAPLITYEKVATYSCNLGYNLVGSDIRTCQADATWSTTKPTCQIQACPALSAPSNGLVDISQGVYQDIATYSCNTGYNLNGAVTTTCGAGGSWSQTPPACDIVDCLSLPNPVDGVVTAPMTTYNQQAVYTCNVGYVRNDVIATRMCQASGSWDGVASTCILADCGNPSSPTDGSVSTPGGTKYDQQAIYNCITGYQLMGAAVRTCQNDENWSNPDPTCQIRDCGNLPEPAFGTLVQTGGTEYEAVATFSCDTGYSPDALKVSTCQDDGTWDVKVHICTIKDCGGLGDPIDGQVSLVSGQSTYGSTATFSCNTGYEPDDSNTADCLENGQWTFTTHTCTIKDCGGLASPVDGSVLTSGGTKYAAIATYYCITGYELIGVAQRTCQPDGLWSDPPPICTIVSCPTLLVPDHGTVDKTNGVYEDEVNYNCDTGYDIQGFTLRTCRADASWSDDDPICDPRDCGPPDDPTDGIAETPDGTTFSQEAVYVCITGFEVLGDPTSTCQADQTWTAADPTCTIKDCGDPTQPLNGRVMFTVTKYGDQASFSCTTGYDLLGDETTACQHDGKWSVYQITNCRIKDCGNLPNPPNGLAVTQDGTTFEQSGTYSCHTGYVQLGEASTVCQADGTWSPEDPLCTIKDCGQPTAPANGYVDTALGTKFKNEATFHCNSGYDLTGDSSTICLSGAVWSQVSEPSCHIRDDASLCTPPRPNSEGQDCSLLPDPDNGASSTTGTTYGQEGIYSCNVGYDLMGASTSQCQADGTWSSTDPLCTIKDCGLPANPQNGEVDTTQGTEYMDEATYSCHSGYDMSGDASTTCQSNGAWTVSAPTVCQVRSCGPPPNPTHGTTDIAQGAYGDVATFSCDSGYMMTADATTLCLDDGSWDGNMAICAIKVCSSLEDPVNGIVNMADGTDYLSEAQFTCNSGYELSGQSSSICQADSTWSGIIPVCSIKVCPALTPPMNGDMIANSVLSFGASVTFTCVDGYDRSHGNTLHCLSNGLWDEVEPTCVIRDCGGLLSPTDGTISLPDGTNFGAEAIYSCYPGYNLIGVTTRECLSTAQWSGSGSPTCVIKDCQPLNTIANGGVNLQDGTLYGAVAVFTCDIGYTLVGELTRGCLDTGTWSGATPTCQINNCGDLPSPVNGLVSIPQGTTYGETATFTCNTGYTLIGYPSRICQSDRSWSNASPTCIVKVCSVLINPNGGTVDISNGLDFGDVATYLCNIGYYMVGTMTVVCQADSSWSDPPPTCQIKDCNDPPRVNNGQAGFPSGTKYLAVAIYHCDNNFALVGDPEVTCEETGTWSVEPVCLPDCGAPAAIVNGEYSVDGNTLSGAVATYTCNNGYRISGSSQVVCQSIGEWNEEPECVIAETPYGTACYIDEECVTPGGVCRDDGVVSIKRCLCFSTTSHYYDVTVDTCLNDCGPLSAPTNGYVANPDITAEGQIATYSCYVGYAVTGQAIRTCLSTGWSGSVPTCSIGCTLPDSPLNGYVNASYGTAAGSTISYSCNDGYSLVGDDTRICLSDTTWNGNEPTCAVQCPDLVGIGHGTVDTSLGNWEGSLATFICSGDYALIGTATRTCLSTGIWTGVNPECIFAVFPDVLIVFLVLFIFLLLIDVFVITFWIYLKYFKSKKNKDKGDESDDDEKYLDEVETPRQQGPARMSFKNSHNGRVGPDYRPSKPNTALHLLPPIPRKPINRRTDGAPYQTHVPKPKPIHRKRQGYGLRDEAVPYVPLVTSHTPPVTFQQTMTDLQEQEPIEQKPDSAKDGYVTSTSEDSQNQKAPSVAEEDQVSIEQQNNSGVEADEPRESPKVMHNATTGFEGRMGLPKIKNSYGNPGYMMGEIKKSLKNSVNAYTPNSKQNDPPQLKPTDKDGMWFP